MQKVKLGSLELSRIVQGFWRLTEWNWTAQQLNKFMNECVELGVTTFDTAEIYGQTECEKQMGEAFALQPGLRDKVQIVSKTGIYVKDGFGYYQTNYDRVMQSCRESIERLQCGYIDLYLIHREDQCFDPWDTARALKELKQHGLVREVGVSNFDPFKFNALHTAMDGSLVTNQIEWNPVCFEHFNSGMMDYLLEKRIKPMYWSPLAGGKLFTDEVGMYSQARGVFGDIAKEHGVDISTMVYAWLLYHPACGLPISGSKKIERLKQAVDALDIKLEQYEWYKMYAASGQQQIK